jgi:L-alanine-DL-glutamate epimerase-like enolase superfamily enzyme
MKVDGLVIYSSNGAKTFKLDPDDSSFEKAVDRAVDKIKAARAAAGASAEGAKEKGR